MRTSFRGLPVQYKDSIRYGDGLKGRPGKEPKLAPHPETETRQLAEDRAEAYGTRAIR